MAEWPATTAWTDLTARGRLFTDVFEFSSDPLVVVDMRGVMMAVNGAMEAIIGMSSEQLVGGEFVDCLHQREQVRDVLRRVQLEKEVRDRAWTMIHGSGRVIEVACNAMLFRDALGQVQGAFFVLRDATDLQQYKAQMLFQASYDALTALPNRRFFHDRLEGEMEQALRYERVLGVLFIDLDNFKDINDMLGHAIGDAGSVVAIHQRVEQLLSAVTQSCVIEGHEVVLSCSIGVTIYPLNNSDANSLVRNAEIAMYRAKEAGKNRSQLFTSEMDAVIQRRVDVSHRLRSALKKSEFFLHYQPRVELVSGRMTGVEALLRWQPEDSGMISPVEFIPVAERNGMVVAVGEWVLFEACRQARQWQLEMGAPVNMAVNLSARQLRDIDIVGLVVRVLEEMGLPARLLELELTESMLVHDTQRVLHTLKALKEIGVSISIDDFGTGYSSLSYLKSFPLDYLKIDRSFVTDIPDEPNNGAIVRAIIDMAHTLGLKVIAEGLETRQQLDFLLERDCNEIQGYFFSKPLPEDQLAILLKDHKKLDL